MPKTSHDDLASLVVLAAFVVGSFLLSRAKKRFSETQRATLRARFRLDPVLLGSTVGLLAAIYFAPVYPALSILAAIVFSVICTTKLVRLHSGQAYTGTTRGLLLASLSTQLAGLLFAVCIRAAL